MKKGPPKAEQRRGSEQRPSRGLWRFRLATSKFPKTPPRRKVQSPDKSEVEDEKDQNIVCICLTRRMAESPDKSEVDDEKDEDEITTLFTSVRLFSIASF